MSNTSLVPAEGGSFRPGYAPYTETVHEAGQQHPLKMLHAFFRGRYWMLILLVAIFTPLGVWGGFKLGVTEYQSDGQVRMMPVLPIVLSKSDKNDQIPMFENYLDAEAATLRSQRVQDIALEDSRWKEWKWPLPDNFGYLVNRELQVNHQGEIISVAVTDPDPKAAMLAVRTIIRAYQQIYEENNIKEDQMRNDLLDTRQTTLRSDVAGIRQQIHDMVVRNPYGTDELDQFYNDKLKEVEYIQQLYQEAKLGKIQGAAAAAGAAGAVVDPTMDEETKLVVIAGQDKPMEYALQAKLKWTEELSQLQSGASPLGDSNSRVIFAKEQLDIANKKIKDREAIYDKQHELSKAAGVLAGGPTTAPTTQPNADRLAQLQAAVAQADSELQMIGVDRINIRDLKDKLTGKQQELDETTKRIESLNVESTLSISGRLQVMNDGTMPVEPSRDTHIAMGALGGFSGMSLGVFFVVLMTLKDRRFHGPEDTGFSAVRCPMLGILPTLTNDLSDPNQAAMAAHFVHGIRAMLQIKGTTAGGRVIAITSPSAHNGKTSISLALGVSFAGAHSKTLLIDCDFIGRALSERTKAVARPRLGRILRHQGLVDEQKLQAGLDHAVRNGVRLGEALVEMGVVPAEKLDAALVAQKDCTFGVLEAIDGEDLAECVAPTAIAGLSILPLGQASAEHIGSLSPAMLKVVLDTARQKYDVVIVDTGPILGSLEAAMVATQADDVVIILSNGENRASAERSLRYLEQVGAKVAGFVFNRATSRDFINSDGAQRMSHASERWRHPRASVAGTPLQHFGPVAHAVARSMSETVQGGARIIQTGTDKNSEGSKNGESNDHGHNGNGNSA